MQFVENIENHLDLLQEMGKAGVPDTFIKEYQEEELLELSRKICRMDAKGVISAMDKQALGYLVHDQGFLDYLVRLLEEGLCEPVRAGRLLIDAGDDALSEGHSYEEIASILSDRKIKTKKSYVYLKYFSAGSLNEAQKEYLMYGLEALDICTELTAADLDEEERGLLMEPAVSSAFLCRRIAERDFWKRLLQPAYRALLSDLSIYAGAGVCLEEIQAEELWQHTEEIQAGLDQVLPKIPAHEIGKFLALWLDNEALAYDLGRLKRLLPDTFCGMAKESTDGESNGREKTFTKNQVAYLNFLYGDKLGGVDLGEMSESQKALLVYGITHKKKHFLSMVKEHFEDFTDLRPYHLLMDADTYVRYLNVNTLNPRNLKESVSLPALHDKTKQYLTRDQYTFEELKLFADIQNKYVHLYHLLSYPKSDDRLRVIREAVKRECLPERMEEEPMIRLGELLSQKPLSKWMSEDMGHIRNLSYRQAALLLSVWDRAAHFILGIQTGHQADFLLHNLEALKDLLDFQAVTEQMLELDHTWKELNEMLQIGEEFLRKNREGVKQFLYDGGSEIFYAFLSGMDESEWEKARRLCVAEIAGRFRELKYYKNDLEREIALRISEKVQKYWMENMEAKKSDFRIWEEDRLLPVMQIGEVLGHTCLSYQSGIYKKCLLSCFDANKKVAFVSVGGRLVFRAMVRLTKGAFSRVPSGGQGLQFADLIQEDMEDGVRNRREYLTLFLERPYFKGISDEKVQEAVKLTVGMLRKKAEQMGAELVLSDSYKGFALEESQLIRAKYYMYISASKNGKQYLDSLGGMAGVQNEGSYEEGYFLLREAFVNPKAGEA